MHKLKLISFIAWRNLIRQKRRNILLGLAIAFGVMVMTISLSFSKGITDNLLNKLIVYISGHVKVNAIEEGRIMFPVIRDQQIVLKAIEQNTTELKIVNEQIGSFGRAIGNGKADYLYIVGINISQNETLSDLENFFQLSKEQFDNFVQKKYPAPVIINENKAEYLNVKIGDQLRVRLTNVNGQIQTGTLTVAGIMKSQNMFMDYAIFTPLYDLKALLGYKPYETGALQLNLKHPERASLVADALHKALQPKTAGVQGKLDNGGNVEIVAWDPATRNSLSLLANALQNTKEAIISTGLAKSERLQINQKILVSYPRRFENQPANWPIKIGAIIDYPNTISTNIIILPRETFFGFYKYNLPKQTELKGVSSEIIPYLATEWKLLPRTHTTKEGTKKMKEVVRVLSKQPILDVSSMYENASMVIQIEHILNWITLISAAILFFIIMIGVLNSLRMTVIERTREIGTLRAMGMRKRDVQLTFLAEVFLLVVLSWAGGTLASFLFMKLMTLIKFGTDNALNILMVNHRLYFLPDLLIFLETFIVITVFALVTAWSPAKKAGECDPAKALSHYT